MSYILDALRRAEAERERGSVPGVHAQAAGLAAPSPAGHADRRSRWTLPAFGVLLAAIGLLGWRPWAVDPPAPVAGPAAVGAPVAVAPPTAAVPASVLPPPTDPPARAPEAPARRAAAPVATATVTKKRPAAAASAAVAEVPPTLAPASAAATEARVLSVAELPPEIRQQLPQLAIGGSIYSASPASRFVIVNGQLFHEGDTLAPGLVLQQIRLKSAVLSFRGYRYGITF